MRYITALCLAASLLTSCGEPAKSDVPQSTMTSSANANAPIVVELFQSQGCSSCPPANAALNELADRKDVIALSFAVTYWDRLGWKDIFAAPAHTQRQRDYAATLKGGSVYTPQVIINGRRELVGNGRGELAGAVSESKGLSGGPAISSAAGNVTIGVGTGKATIWLIRYDPRSVNVAIKAGENDGRTLPHRNIVRQMTKLGNWSGAQQSYALPKAANAGLRTAILVQSGSTGPILSAKVI
jgi:hypothetical protein